MKSVVFDMDGVIFDSERLVLECWTELGKEYGMEHMDTLFKRCIGTNTAGTKEIFKEIYGDKFDFDEFKKRSSDMFHSRYDGGRLPMKPGVVELLQYLKDNSYRIALASSTRYEVVRQELTDAGLIDFFDEIVCGDMVSNSKPAPDIFLKACELLGANPQFTFAIEDSYNGIIAASRAGMIPIMVPDLIAPNPEMERLAHFIFGNLNEVKYFFQSQDRDLNIIQQDAGK